MKRGCSLTYLSTYALILKDISSPASFFIFSVPQFLGCQNCTDVSTCIFVIRKALPSMYLSRERGIADIAHPYHRGLDS